MDKVGEKEAVQISKISIASMLVPFYFIFIFILQVLHFINPKELDWILPTVITIIAVKVILLIGFLPHKFQLHGKGKMFYSWILVVLSTTVVAVGFDPILGQTKKDFLEIYSVCVFLFLASVLTVAYLSQRPRDFILKLLINKTNLKGKTILYVSGISGGWWFLWLITSSTELHVACMIFFIAVITFWQSYSVEETGKWIFDETHSGSSLVVT